VVVRIGTCGWSYDHWQPELYAPGLPAAGRLARHAAIFPTAELNSSFYRWPRPSAFTNWRRKLPALRGCGMHLAASQAPMSPIHLQQMQPAANQGKSPVPGSGKHRGAP
jgi:hypothetical protein